MLNTTNTYFENLRKMGNEWQDKKDAHEAKKQEIIDTYGWESNELKVWYEEKNNMRFPFAEGTCKAYRAWNNSVDNGYDEVEMDDFLWDKEVEDFVQALKSAGIGTFIYTNSSTSLMENIHDLVKNGCVMEGLVEFEREDRWAGAHKVQGIRFSCPLTVTEVK